MPTARELADRYMEARQAAWAKADPTTAIVATEQLNPDDERALRLMLEDAGYHGEELSQMCRQVAALVVGKVEGLADKLPATGGD
jgi:uncharacterized membrane protein